VHTDTLATTRFMPRVQKPHKSNRQNEKYISPYTLLSHRAPSAHVEETFVVASTRTARHGIDPPLEVLDRAHAFKTALDVWTIGESMHIQATVRDAVYTLWDACNPGAGNKFFKQRSKWQRFVAFVFMIMDNARSGRRLDRHVRKCCCVWTAMDSLACIQTIPTRLRVKSSWYTTRQVQFMGTLDRISRTPTSTLDCLHCTHERS
jgi:hypothetical protein